MSRLGNIVASVPGSGWCMTISRASTDNNPAARKHSSTCLSMWPDTSPTRNSPTAELSLSTRPQTADLCREPAASPPPRYEFLPHQRPQVCRRRNISPHRHSGSPKIPLANPDTLFYVYQSCCAIRSRFGMTNSPKNISLVILHSDKFSDSAV
jgi:hypothetical protein